MVPEVEFDSDGFRTSVRELAKEKRPPSTLQRLMQNREVVEWALRQGYPDADIHRAYNRHGGHAAVSTFNKAMKQFREVCGMPTRRAMRLMAPRDLASRPALGSLLPRPVPPVPAADPKRNPSPAPAKGGDKWAKLRSGGVADSLKRR